MLARADAIVGAWGGELAFVYLPTPTKRAAAARQHCPPETRGAVLEAVERLGLPHVDLSPLILGPDQDDLIALDGFGHLTVEGNARVGDMVVETLLGER